MCVCFYVSVCVLGSPTVELICMAQYHILSLNGSYGPITTTAPNPVQPLKVDKLPQKNKEFAQRCVTQERFSVCNFQAALLHGSTAGTDNREPLSLSRGYYDMVSYPE